MSPTLDFFAAANATTVDRLRAIPTEFWVKVGLGLLAVVAIVIFLRKIAGMNKVVLAVIMFLTVSFIGFSWIYERNEPSWATPFVERVAAFFPSKGAIKQKDLPK